MNDCPKCGMLSVVTNTIRGQRETTRYRHCRICNTSYATVETIKDTPRIRLWLGEKAAKFFPPKPFKYRTIKQQTRAQRE